ncbi:hypothetical protein WG66_005452 [Moniliophthora roreri]|nr:hypothetical protein WG66_005452 [Moniliophthora roreri]
MIYGLSPLHKVLCGEEEYLHNVREESIVHLPALPVLFTANWPNPERSRKESRTQMSAWWWCELKRLQLRLVEYRLWPKLSRLDVTLGATGRAYARRIAVDEATHGGDGLHWFWAPYEIYQETDLVYSVEALSSGEGLANALTFLNIVETLLISVYLHKAHVSTWPATSLIGLNNATWLIGISLQLLFYWAYYARPCDSILDHTKLPMNYPPQFHRW